MKDIPNGYLPDPKGRLVPIKLIREVDLLEHSLVEEKLAEAYEVSALLAEFKGRLAADIHAFRRLASSEHDAKYGGDKGNVTLRNYPADKKITLTIQDRKDFDSGLDDAKALMDEYLAERTEELVELGTDAGEELRIMINEFFGASQAGNINVTLSIFYRLKRIKIRNEKWLKAIAALDGAVRVIGTASYVRCYATDDSTEKLAAVLLDLASVKPTTEAWHFILRLDEGCEDPLHRAASLAAMGVYCDVLAVGDPERAKMLRARFGLDKAAEVATLAEEEEVAA
jgi:hypothetical protein